MQPLMLPLIPQFKSFISTIGSKRQLYVFMEKYIRNTNIIDITLEPFLKKQPPPPPLLFPYSGNVRIISLYGVNIWMGSIEKYPAVSQLQFLLRIMINDFETDQYYYMFVELFINIDEENAKKKVNCLAKRIKSGYRFYTTDPFTFLMMIQASDVGRNVLRDMMIADGISIPSLLLLSENLKIISEGKFLLTLQHYFNYYHFFSNKFNKNIHWTSTQKLEIYEQWLVCQQWPIYLANKIYNHKPYCLRRENIFNPENVNFKSLIPEVRNRQCLKGFKRICIFKEYRVFDDGEYDYDKLFCLIDWQYIDRLYHIRCLTGRSSTTNEYVCYRQYELIVRMVGRQPEDGFFYLEMIVSFFSNYVLDENILFITRNPQLFMDVIQSGKKSDICNFIIEDEGLPLCENNNNNLLSKCMNVLIKNLLSKSKPYNKAQWTSIINEEIQTNPNIPNPLKIQLIYKSQQKIIIKLWKKSVEYVTTSYHLLDNIKEENLIWEDNFNIRNFSDDWFSGIQYISMDRSNCV